MRHTKTQTYKQIKMARQTDYVTLRYLDKSTVAYFDCSDLKSTMSAGRSFHTFT